MAVACFQKTAHASNGKRNRGSHGGDNERSGNDRESTAEDGGWVAGKDAVEEEVEAHGNEHSGCDEGSDAWREP